MTEFVTPRGKTCAYLINDYNDNDYDEKKIINKKAKRTKRCVIKRELMFEHFKNCVLNDKIILKKQQAFRIDHHKVYTVEIKKLH